MGRRFPRGTAALGTLALLLAAEPAGAVWVRLGDLTYNTAYTLEQEELEVGLVSPVRYGITQELSLAVHPILWLLAAPNLSGRYKVFDSGPIAIAVNAGLAWSWLQEEDSKGQPANTVTETGESCQDCGYPGAIQLTGTISWAAHRRFLVSAGFGGALEFLDLEPDRGLVELHASMHWLPDPENLVMLHLTGFLAPGNADVLQRPNAQLLYAHAFDFIHVGIGVAFGDFPFRWRSGDLGESGRFDKTFILPVLDVWVRR